MRAREEAPRITQWLLRLTRLERDAFAEVAANPDNTVIALATVVVASFLCGLGSWLWWALQFDYDHGRVLVRTLFMGTILQVGAWLLWVYVTYQVLTLGFNLRVSFYPLARALGIAFAPMGLTIAMALAPLAVPLAVIPIVLTALASQVAVESVSRAGMPRALLANLGGFVTFALTLGILANVSEVRDIGGVAPGLFFFALD